MREHKYRWFDKEAHANGDKGMIYGDNLPSEYELTVDNKGQFVLLIEGLDCDVMGLQWEEIKCEPMQFTGLQDKNGTDIYQGDFVEQLREDNCYGGLLPLITVLIRESEYYELTSWPSGGPDGDYPIIEMTVIGNIHENPELLETK